MDTRTNSELATLSEMNDYKVCSGEPDPRGWFILDANGVQIGNVEDLIIDREALTARYMVCSLCRGTIRSVLLPIGFARLEKMQRVVHLDFVTAADIDQLPAFRGLPPSAELLTQTEQVLTGDTTESRGAKIVRRRDETRNAS